jgi:CDP-4-dehydro-6-deoxyglucose reductase
MAIQPWRKGIVIRILQEAPATHRYFIQVPELERFDFEPGQFVTLDLPIGEKTSERWRSYSIASWPDGTNVFELVIVLAEGGKGTDFLFNAIKEGNEISFRGAQGKFTLPENIDRDLYLICTGTGIAPFRSMVHHILNNNITHRHIYLVFGCRKKSDILYYDELVDLSHRIENFHYYPTLSREEWEGKTGYVHEVYAALLKEKPPAYFFLCGWKNMINDARHRLAELGYNKKEIHFELYG